MDKANNEFPPIRVPLPSYKEKIDAVEESLKEWVKLRHYHRPGVKLSEVAAETGIAFLISSLSFFLFWVVFLLLNKLKDKKNSFSLVKAAQVHSPTENSTRAARNVETCNVSWSCSTTLEHQIPYYTRHMNI